MLRFNGDDTNNSLMKSQFNRILKKRSVSSIASS